MRTNRTVALSVLILVLAGWVGLAEAAKDSQIVIGQSDVQGLTVALDVAEVKLALASTKAGEFVKLDWPGASKSGEIGSPALPVVRKLFVAPLGAEVRLEVSQGDVSVIDLGEAGFTVKVKPVQPPIAKIAGAIDKVVFQYDAEAYVVDEYLPSERALVKELGIVRGKRVFLLELYPVSYNPVAHKIAFWPGLEVDLFFDGATQGKGDDALPGLGKIVINPELMPAAKAEGGNYLIVVADLFEAAIASFASAKEDQGFSVTTFAVSADTTNVDIKTYIESLWGTADAPDYILLVGDTKEVPHWKGGGSETPDTDLPYGCMDGPADWYPDIAVGRFPVQTTEQLADVVEKTLAFENGSFADDEYLGRAVFMASQDNYNISEGTHNSVIGNYLLPYGIVSDRLYSRTFNATTQQVRDAFNDGRLYGVYSGHGSENYWADGPVFNQNDVRNLTNGDRYPFVLSFACVTGAYALPECFTETWLLAGGSGAVAVYGASVDSYWTEDDVLEKLLFEVLFDDGVREVGPCWNATRMRYLAQMGAGITTRRYFEMYNLMGDPSVYIPWPPPLTGIKVTPQTGVESEGAQGGPFTPESVVCTVENQGETELNYEVTVDVDWLAVDSPSGPLAAGEIAEVIVSIGPTASLLGLGSYEGQISFVNTTDHDGDASSVATLVVGVPTVQYSWNMDENPGWKGQGAWAWGRPAGRGGHSGGSDPKSGYTGDNVCGYNLSGDYKNNMPEHVLVTRPINCAGLSRVGLRFQQWRGVEGSFYDHATVKVSNNLIDWVAIWKNPPASLSDSSWSLQEFDISDIADGEATVYIKWTMGPTDSSVVFCGWNIDDVEITGIAESK